MLKRVISLFVGATCLLSMTGVFAASYTGTTTTYMTDGTIKVDTTVTSNIVGDVATYLVYSEEIEGGSGAITTGDQIVYVDQYEFTGEEANNSKTFSYQTSSANVGAHIALGADVEGTVERGVVEGITVNVSVTNASGVVTSSTTVIDPLPEDGENGTEWIQIPVTLNGNVTSVKLGETTLTADSDYLVGANCIWVQDSKIPTNVTSFDLAVTTDTSEDSLSSGVSTLGITYLPAESNNLESTAASIVVVGAAAGDVAEFGIILAKSEEAAEDLVLGEQTDAVIDGSSANAVMLPALGRSADAEGKFAVRVYDTEGFSGTLYATSYIKLNTGEYLVCHKGKYLTVSAN